MSTDLVGKAAGVTNSSLKARFTRRFRCPVCGGADEDPRGKGIRCFGFLSSDGGYAHCSRIPVGAQENGGTWAHRLTGDCNCGTPHGEAPPPPSLVVPRKVIRDVPRIWSELALSDRAGQQYLEGRHLWDDGLPDTESFRFNTGTSCDDWMNARAEEGYRCAFAARRPDGTIQTIVLRHAGEATSRYGKAPTMPGCSTAGAAICRPEIRLLLEGDPEFEHDEIEIVEGPTDFLASTLLRDELHRDYGARPSWALGCIGAGQAVDVVKAFASIIRGRLVRVTLDSDKTGGKNALLAAEAARRAGAWRVELSVLPDGVKDIAELWRSMA